MNKTNMHFVRKFLNSFSQIKIQNELFLGQLRRNKKNRKKIRLEGKLVARTLNLINFKEMYAGLKFGIYLYIPFILIKFMDTLPSLTVVGNNLKNRRQKRDKSLYKTSHYSDAKSIDRILLNSIVTVRASCGRELSV